jgi:PIN domain nuclease of toxin-antitoxin system
MSNVYYLDACALLAVVKKEDGALVVVDVYKKATAGEVVLCMNLMNLLEVYYGFYREKGKAYADMVVQAVDNSVINVTNTSRAVFVEAGRLKASYAISLADSIALAEASVAGGTLITSDHHELDVVEKNEGIRFLWFR